MNLDFDDLSKLEEIYIDNDNEKPIIIDNIPEKKEILESNKIQIPNNEDKIKTIYIDTKNDKNTFNDDTIDINYETDNGLEKFNKKKYSRNEYSFFN